MFADLTRDDLASPHTQLKLTRLSKGLSRLGTHENRETFRFVDGQDYTQSGQPRQESGAGQLLLDFLDDDHSRKRCGL